MILQRFVFGNYECITLTIHCFKVCLKCFKNERLCREKNSILICRFRNRFHYQNFLAASNFKITFGLKILIIENFGKHNFFLNSNVPNF